MRRHRWRADLAPDTQALRPFAGATPYIHAPARGTWLAVTAIEHVSVLLIGGGLVNAPRWISTGILLFASACAGDVPARTPVLTSAEMISPGDLEGRVARVGYDADRAREGERRRWVELELRHAEDKALVALLWRRYERADLVLTALEQRQARTPTADRRALDEQIGSAEAARLRVQLWVRRALASSDEWDETRAQLEAALVDFGAAVEGR
jgi:hypothetical protein